jgi:hypothetical protein
LAAPFGVANFIQVFPEWIAYSRHSPESEAAVGHRHPLQSLEEVCHDY